MDPNGTYYKWCTPPSAGLMLWFDTMNSEKENRMSGPEDCKCECGSNEPEVVVTDMNGVVEDLLIPDAKMIAEKLIGQRQLEGNRMGMLDDNCNTNLISKNYSPMFIRKFNATAVTNWPMYISMICDEDVSDIDHVVNGALDAYAEAGLITNDLQAMRNLTGIISETLSQYYDAKKKNCVEGIAVTLYVDKAYIQSLSGDFMNHAQCRSEYTAALRMMTQI